MGKKESKRHKYRIDEMFEMKSISYLSTPRPNKRGGGSAISCDDRNFYTKENKVPNPNNLEVTDQRQKKLPNSLSSSVLYTHLLEAERNQS